MAPDHTITLILLVFLRLCLGGLKYPKVVIENGKIFGLYKKSFSGYTFESFQGIPYAEPPVKDNRFKEPIPYRRKWLGVWNATMPSGPCLQISQFIKMAYKLTVIKDHKYAVLGEEDCLYLNVYTRDSVNTPTLKAVIVFIHPGGFTQTDAGAIGPEYLMDRDDIVLVTFNYRLGIFGFLSTGDSVVPGNNGLKDQVCALKWVQQNIKAFGGDPTRVTITGLSAGGASVHYMMLSPLSKGLFHRAISFSGTAFCPWALIHDVPEKSKKLAALVGCPTTSSAEMISCLRQRSSRHIIKQIENFQVWLYNPFTIFGPTIEKNSTNAFISEHPVDITNQKKLKNIPWIVTAVSEEALYPAAEYIFDLELLKHLNNNWKDLAPSLLFFNDSIPRIDHEEITKKIKNEYLHQLGFSTTSRDEILKMMGDRLYVAPAVNAAYLSSQNRKEPVYFYMYRQKNSVAISEILFGVNVVIGVSHADDVSLIFNLQGTRTLVSAEDKEMSKHLIHLLIDFAKTGKPSAGLNWHSALSDKGKFSYLDIRSSKEMNMVVSSNEILGNPKKIAEIFQKEKSAKVGMIFNEGNNF